MKVKLKLKDKMTQKIIAVLLLVTVTGGSIGFYLWYQQGKVKNPVTENLLYKEEQVKRRNLVVGVSEMGTAKLIAQEVALAYDMEVQEIKVKAGQYVTKDQVLAQIDMEAYAEIQAEAEEEIADAREALELAELEQTSKEQEASATKEQNQETGNSAKQIYELELAAIQQELSNYDRVIQVLQEEKTTVQDKIATLNTQLEESTKQAKVVEGVQLVNALVSEGQPEPLEPKLEPPQPELSESERPEVGTEQPDVVKPEQQEVQPEVVEPEQPNIVEPGQPEEQKQEESTSSQNTQIEAELSAAKIQLAEIENKIKTQENARSQYAAKTKSLEQEAKATYDKSVQLSQNATAVYNNTVQNSSNAVEEAEKKLEELLDAYTELTYINEAGELLSPCDGFVMNIQEQSVQSTGSADNEKTQASPLQIQIADSDVVTVQVSIAQEDIANIELDMETNVVFDAYDDIEIPAQVDAISIMPSGGMQSSVNYTVDITCSLVDLEDLKIYEGMTSTVTFIEKQKQDVLVVSNKCIRIEDGKQLATVKQSDGTLEQVAVETGFSDGFDVEIISGINEGDVVVIESAVNTSANR